MACGRLIPTTMNLQKHLNIPEPTKTNEFRNNMQPVPKFTGENPGMYTMQEILNRDFTPPVKAKHYREKLVDCRNPHIGLHFATELLKGGYAV